MRSSKQIVSYVRSFLIKRIISGTTDKYHVKNQYFPQKILIRSYHPYSRLYESAPPSFQGVGSHNIFQLKLYGVVKQSVCMDRHIGSHMVMLRTRSINQNIPAHQASIRFDIKHFLRS